MPTQETQNTLKQLIDEAFEKVEASYQAEIDAANAKIEELEAKLRIQLDAETDVAIRELTAREKISVEAWIVQELKRAVEFADMPFIRVHPAFYENLKKLADMRGVMPESLTTTPDVTKRFMSLIDNLLI